MDLKEYNRTVHKETDRIFADIIRRRAVYKKLGSEFSSWKIRNYRFKLSKGESISMENKIKVLLAYGYVPITNIRWT